MSKIKCIITCLATLLLGTFAYSRPVDKIVVYYLLHDDHTATVTTKRPGRRAEYRIRELPVNKITILHSIEDELSEKPYSVVAVEDSAFASTNIEEIVLPSSIVRIGKNAFRNCKKMTKCNLGKGPVIKEIGDYAFAYSGISSIYGNRSVKHLGEGAFLQCENLSIVYETIYLKDIGQSAFKNCFHLQQAPLHDGLERIEADAFERCDSLIEVYIPSSVNYIGRNPFAYCHQLKKIVVDANNINYDSRDSCNAIIGRDERNMLKLLSGCHTTKIPKDVQLLGENAFAGCVNLRIIDIPNAVKRIQTGAFLSCSKLESIILPDALEICEDKSWIRWNDVFGNCNNLSMVSLPKSMTYIKREFFKNNKSLKHLYIPNTIVRIDAEAFKKCTELKYVAIPGSVNINESAFDGCDSVVIYTPNQSMFKAMKGKIKSVQEIDENELKYYYPFTFYYQKCMNSWNKKSKYESKNMYETRIADSDKIHAEQERIKQEYINYHTKINPPCPYIGKYNADMEIFPVYDDNYGKVYLSVPIVEWKVVKEEWRKAEFKYEYDIINNEIEIIAIEVQLPRERIYRSR